MRWHKKKVPECADVAICIVDLTGRNHTAWSMRMRHQLQAEMPWVHTVRSADPWRRIPERLQAYSSSSSSPLLAAVMTIRY